MDFGGQGAGQRHFERRILSILKAFRVQVGLGLGV